MACREYNSLLWVARACWTPAATALTMASSAPPSKRRQSASDVVGAQPIPERQHDARSHRCLQRPVARRPSEATQARKRVLQAARPADPAASRTSLGKGRKTSIISWTSFPRAATNKVCPMAWLGSDTTTSMATRRSPIPMWNSIPDRFARHQKSKTNPPLPANVLPRDSWHEIIGATCLAVGSVDKSGCRGQVVFPPSVRVGSGNNILRNPLVRIDMIGSPSTIGR